MSEVNLHELQMLVTKARHADDDSYEGACRELAKYIHMNSIAIDTLKALVERGPLHDGDVPSKTERDLLLDVGLCVKVASAGSDGANAATQLAASVWKRYGELTEAQIVDPAGADGVIGGTGTDDSGVELTSIADPLPASELTPSVESVLTDALSSVKRAFSAPKPEKLPEAAHIQTDLATYIKGLKQTYADPKWVTARGLTNKSVSLLGGTVLLDGNNLINAAEWKHRLRKYSTDVVRLVKAIDEIQDAMLTNLSSYLSLPAAVVVPKQLEMATEDQDKVYFSVSLAKTELMSGLIYSKETDGPFTLEENIDRTSIQVPVLETADQVIDAANALIAFCEFIQSALGTPISNFFDENALNDWGDWDSFSRELENLPAADANVFYSRVIHSAAIRRYGSHHFYAVEVAIFKAAKLLERMLDVSVK